MKSISDNFDDKMKRVNDTFNEKISILLDKLPDQKCANEAFDDKLNGISDSLNNKMNSLLDKCPSDNLTYSAKVQQGLQQDTPTTSGRSNPEVLILSPTDTISSSEVKDVAKEVSKNLEGVSVAFLKVNENSGKVVVGFPNKSEKQKGEKLVSNIKQFTENKYSMKST